MSDMSCAQNSSTCSVAESARIIEQLRDGMAPPPGWLRTGVGAAGACRQLGSRRLGRRASPGWRGCAGAGGSRCSTHNPTDDENAGLCRSL